MPFEAYFNFNRRLKHVVFRILNSRIPDSRFYISSKLIASLHSIHVMTIPCELCLVLQNIYELIQTSFVFNDFY